MTQQTPTFSVSDFELRNYTNSWLTPAQATEVTNTEDRVNAQLNFLAQMLGWNGPNYWGNLAVTPDQKRQLLGGTFGVYNSYLIPKVYEFRQWDNTIVVDRLQFLQPGRSTQIARVLVGDNVYLIQSVAEEGDKFVISIGELTDDFFTQIANGTPVRVDFPSYRPAPFYRPDVGVSGDASFVCGTDGSSLTLYPAYDNKKQFPYLSPILFAGSVYYFDQPIYFSLDSSLSLQIAPTYDPNQEKWFLEIPGTLAESVGIAGYLVWANSGSSVSTNYSLEVLIQPWANPSDWSSINVLDNFRGVWGNKGGDLPFNFVFDALGIHGVDENNSLHCPPFDTNLDFNDIVNYVYYQKAVVSDLAPGDPTIGDVWWNDETGALAVWLPGDSGCGSWVEVDYRQSPNSVAPPEAVYPDVATFQAQSPSLSVGTVVRISDITGLSIADNVLGVQGTLTAPGQLILHRATSDVYWTPDEFIYSAVSDFEADAQLLPFKTPVVIKNATGLTPSASTYSVRNLGIPVTGDYDVLLRKFYNNTFWEIYPDSILKYIAFSALFNDPKQGEMWWDFVNPLPSVRSAAIFYSSPSAISTLSISYEGASLPNGTYTGVPLTALSGTGGQAQADITVAGGVVTAVSVTVGAGGDKYQLGDLVGPDSTVNPLLVGAVFEVTSTASQAWVNINAHPQSGPPTPVFNMGVLLFYCNGELVTPGVSCVTDDFTFGVIANAVTGQYEFSYKPYTLSGKTQLPVITISDSITTTYRADISTLVFSGLTYKLAPNVYDSETLLRLWKAQDLQVVENLNELAENNYINPLRADLNNGPGPENWEKYFVRLPMDYGRNETVWQKVALVCQDFAYWGSSIEPEKMECPPEDDLPAIYEELFLYDQPISDYTYVYCEPYLYSNVAYTSVTEAGDFFNSGIFPASDVQFDEFNEAETIIYEPLHNRQANVTSPVGAGYGDWIGDYVNVNPCVPLTGFYTADLVNGGLEPVSAPVWDASIYKYAPTCESAAASYDVDTNHFRIGYAYFVADASAAEDAFFDIQQEAAWRYPVTQPKTLYLTPR